MVDSPSPPAADRRSRSRSPSSGSRSSTIRNGTSHHSQSSSSHNNKDYAPSRSTKGYVKESIKVVQVANIAPQATREQMQALFGYVGKIDDIRLYPTMDIGLQLQSKICFVKFYDSTSVGSAQHLTNTVFIDRALIVIPYLDGDIPDEQRALELLASGSLLPGIADPKLPQHVTSQLEGMPPLQVVITKDPRLMECSLPLYPPLPPTVDSRKIEEIRRTIMVCNIDPDLTAADVMEYFSAAGEVKYFRFCTRDNDPLKFALIEFSDQPAILEALQFNGQALGHKVIRVYHATQAIIKPQAKTNEAAQKEIEEAMTRQAQNLLTQGLDTAVAPASIKEKRRSRSRSRSHSRRSRSRGRRRSRSRSRRRSRSRSRRSSSRHRDKYRSSKTKKSRSRSRERKRSRSRGRRSRSRGRTRRSESRSRSRRSRSRSKKRDDKKKSKKDKDRDREKERVKDKEKDHKENGDESDTQKDKKKAERRSRSPKQESKKRRRSRSRSRSRKARSPSHEKRRSKAKKKKKDNSDREPSVDSVGRNSRSSSQEKRLKKEFSGDIEYDDKSDVSRSHGDESSMMTA